MALQLREVLAIRTVHRSRQDGRRELSEASGFAAVPEGHPRALLTCRIPGVFDRGKQIAVALGEHLPPS